MTSVGTEKDKIEHNKEADNHGPEQQPLFFRHRSPPTGIGPPPGHSNSSAVRLPVHVIDKTVLECPVLLQIQDSGV